MTRILSIILLAGGIPFIVPVVEWSDFPGSPDPSMVVLTAGVLVAGRGRSSTAARKESRISTKLLPLIVSKVVLLSFLTGMVVGFAFLIRLAGGG